MTQARKKKLTARIITAIVLYVLAAILILVSVFGFFLRGTTSTPENLNTCAPMPFCMLPPTAWSIPSPAGPFR